MENAVIIDLGTSMYNGIYLINLSQFSSEFDP